MTRDDRVVERFQREAKTAAKLDHPHIIPIYRVESEGGLNYFVMKYVPGRSLESLMTTGTVVPLDFAQRVLCEAASALGHAHQRGVVHRDVKPANIMLDAQDRAILTDFGISKASESASQLTHTGTIVGTPYYMSPEQAMGLPVDGRADQYSLAVVAYQLLTGELLFTGESAHTILFKHIYDEAPRITLKRRDAPPHIEAALAKALSKAAAERFATMEDLLGVLGGTVSPPLLSSATRLAATHSADTVRTPPATRGTSSVSRDTTEPIPGTGRRTSDATAIYGTRRPLKIALLGGLGVLAVSGAATVSMRRSSGETRMPDVVTVPQGARDGTSLLTVASAQSPNPVPPLPDTTEAAAGSAPVAIEPAAPTPAKPKPVSRTRPRAAAPKIVEDEVRQVAMLTVQADPWGTVYVDGVEIGPSPIVDHALGVGRKYEIRVEHEGYKTRREMITVSGPNAIRRRYILEPGGSE